MGLQLLLGGSGYGKSYHMYSQVIEKSLNGSFLFSIFCIKLAVIFGSSGVMVG